MVLILSIIVYLLLLEGRIKESGGGGEFRCDIFDTL
jgi:hypothetical protein